MASLINDIRLLQGNFLISTPLLKDPLFERSIVFMSEFKDGSAYGFLVDYLLEDSMILEDVNKEIEGSIFENSEVYLGGPIDLDHVFVIHSNDVFCNKTLQVSDDVSISNLSDAINNFQYAPNHFKIFSGYSEWKSGQIEKEIKKGFWMVKNFSETLFFLKSKKKWQKTLETFNIDYNLFSLNYCVA